MRASDQNDGSEETDPFDEFYLGLFERKHPRKKQIISDDNKETDEPPPEPVADKKSAEKSGHE